MALHKRHTHGRVFRGEAAREQLALRKRENGNDQPVMDVPVEKRQNNGVKVVYVTLSQTFSGPAYYLTLSTQPAQGKPKATPSPTALRGAPVQAQASSSASSAAATSIAVVTPTPTPTQAITSISSSASELESTTFATSSRALGTPLQAGETSSATAKAVKEEESSSGMSTGSKAGLAFGIILLIGAIAGACYFFLWRKRKQRNARNVEIMNEKRSSFTRPPSWSNKSIPAPAATGAFAAPIVRPVDHSRSMDEGERVASQRDSIQTEKVPASVRSARTTSTAPRLSLRPITQLMPGFGGVQDNNGAGAEGERRENPFNDGTEKARPVSPPSDPFDGANSVATPQSSTFSTASAVAMAVGGAPPPRGPNNVHRVQLDFKPSMDDELELRSGQLVRMLHEYDDGWALCIRMDRSHQGVAPRTCLSKLPVKPRPQGPPPQQGSRPGTANSNRGPPNAPGAMVPRPLTPSSSDRSISPPMRSEMRPSPDSTTPPAGAMPARKPVPGQAM